MLRRRKLFGPLSFSSLCFSTSPQRFRCIWDPITSLCIDHPVLVLLEKCQTREHFKQILALMTRSHLIFQTFPLSRLLNFSAASHSENLDLAVALFDNFALKPNLFMYNMMLRALSFCSRQTSVYYRSMREHGIFPNNHTLIAMIKSSRSFSLQRQIHAHVVLMGLSLDAYLQNSLIKMYCDNGEMCHAWNLFRNLKRKDATSCNIMIIGLAKTGNSSGAIELMQDLISSDFELDEYTVVALLLCCRELRDWHRGRSIHAWMTRRTSTDEWGMVLCNSVLDFYSKSGNMNAAVKYFDELKNKDDVSWNTMIARLAEFGDFDHALRLFDQMPERNLVSWNSLLSGYAQNRHWDSVIMLFKEMLLHKIIPDEVSIVVMICASSELSLLHQGRAFHGWVLKNNAHLDPFVGSALVDMYSRCGSLERAIITFRSIPKRDVALWTAMISGLAFHGRGAEALLLFQEMQSDGMVPNELTFIAVLTACAHAGLVDSGCTIFESMKKNHGINPMVEHYGCFVDLLARGGRLREARKVIMTLPMRPSRSMWGAFLASSKAHGEIETARFAYKELLKLEPEEDGSYVLLSSAYASSGRWSLSGDIREMMNHRGVKKTAGWSRVVIDNVAHRFIASDLNHQRWKEIYHLLSCLNTEMTLNLAGS